MAAYGGGLCRRVVFAFAHGVLPQAAYITPFEPARSAGRTRGAQGRSPDGALNPGAEGASPLHSGIMYVCLMSAV